MTIGEKIKELFPKINFGTLAQDDMVVNKDYSNNNELQVFIPKRVWNAEYKEPNKSKNLTSSTTKSGISNKSIIYKAKDTKEIQKDLDKLSKLNEPTIQERQAESDKFDAAFQDGYNNGYAQGRFDYEQEPKTGHWEEIPYSYHYYNDQEMETTDLRCSCCKEIIEWDIDRPHKPYYCENCGARMVEPQESKDK